MGYTAKMRMALWYTAEVRRFFAAFTTQYRKIFSIEEIEQEEILQWMFGASLFFFFVTFSKWVGSPIVTVETAERSQAICWPFFQHCTSLYFLHALPDGYTQTELYSFFYLILLGIVYFIWRKKWSYAHMLLALLFVWKLFVISLSATIAGPYDYYHVFLTFILLFVPLKEFFLKLSFVFFYFMSVTVKFDPTWTLGTYFTSMKTGLPVFPTFLTPILTNLVIFMQVVGCWYLMSKNMILQRIALGYFTLFHLYSIILVYYVYPSISLPTLLILFGPMYRNTPIPFSRKAIIGWLVILMIAGFQLAGTVISPDRRITLEGDRFGMFMFEANHQCRAAVTEYKTGAINDSKTVFPDQARCSQFYCLDSIETHEENGLAVTKYVYDSPSAWNRCDPYWWYTWLNQICAKDNSIERIALTFDHSIDGGPFYRIVDVANICELTYSPFSHNPWIKLPPEAPIVGFPVQNGYIYY